MNLFRTAQVLLISVYITGCTNTARTPIDKEGITLEISTVFSSFVSAMNSLSTDQLKNFYSNDSRFFWTEDGQIQYPDKASLTASLGGLMQSLKSTDLKVLELKIEVLDQKSAMLFAEYEQTLTMQSNFGFEINGAMTVLLQKEEGDWKFLIGHSSTQKQRGE